MPEVNKPAVQKKSENLPEPHKTVMAEGGDTIARLLVEQGLITPAKLIYVKRISIETSGLITLMEDGIAKAARGKVSLPEVMRRLPRILKPRPLHELRCLLGE